MRRNGFAGLGTCLALAMLLAACGSASGGATAAPSVAPTPEPTAPLGLFTGHDKCRDAPEPTGAGPDEVWITCDRVATDPRLSGTLLGENHGFGNDPSLYSSWAKLTLTNDGGTWTCDEMMMAPMEGEGGAGFRDQVCVGEGAYKGLTAYLLTLSNNEAADFGIFGWVEETP